jgi:ATP-dependent Lon protease
VTTANTLNSIPPALLDRLEVIDFPGYIEEEKVIIAEKFLVPRQLEQNGLTPDDLTFHEELLLLIIRDYTWEAGVRNLERSIGTICRKTARRKAEGRPLAPVLTKAVIARLLGPAEVSPREAEKKDQVGAAMGLAWTENGGETMPVEVLLVEGKGGVQVTGQVGEVMQESAQAAVSYIKSRARQLGIDPETFEKSDIHIHVPEGAIPKDGPSAGITMATALASALTRRPVRHEVGMSGEITLRGRVLPIGGVREKVLAAHRLRLKTVILPAQNRKDLVEIPRKARHEIDVRLVRTMDKVLDLALAPSVSKPPRGGGRPRKSPDRPVPPAPAGP